MTKNSKIIRYSELVVQSSICFHIVLCVLVQCFRKHRKSYCDIKYFMVFILT
uniref:Uncharacterized protein n=1 Tax=Marseillevirus sp. TaxID=2809551 RepID=A0AA96J0F3_9VIRU|nr:hypothetical protein MarFTMF_031 [Marseillevirus sp.]